MLLNRFSSRSFSTTRKKFDPSSLLPSQYKHIRVLNNTTRDAQQSNCSAEMSHGHRMKITKMIDECYKSIQNQPGYEQIWGGTIPMFDIWKRGVQPFDALRQQIAYLPNTPTSMLFRSNAINSMSNLPFDVIDSFVKNSVECGMDVYTNFDAHNDHRNHKAVAESVLKYGGHYQAALSWAVYNPDPTIYNVRWAVDFFRECVKMGAHSLYVKDPSGVLTPDMAYALSREIKEAFPDLPLVYHTHYQSGYGYMTYLKAAEGGANGIECSVGFADGAGQPYSLTMLRTLEELGFNTGNPDKLAMRKISDYCKDIRPKYAMANIMKSPDMSVEDSGIAGGQRSILDKELRDVGQASLIPRVDIEVAAVRAQGGKVCQVTPVADTYAREAMRRLRGGNPASGFVPGYAGILCGEGGSVKELVDPVQQKQALLERVQAAAKALQNNGSLSAVITSDGKFLTSLVDQMLEAVAPILSSRRLEEVNSRISQLETISKKPELKQNMDLKFIKAVTYPEAPAKSLDERIQQLKAEKSTLEKFLAGKSAKDIESINSSYESLLRDKADKTYLQGLLSKNKAAQDYISNKKLTPELYSHLLSRAGYVTCVTSELLAPAMERSRAFIKDMESKEALGMCESPQIYEDLSILHACFEKAALPNLYNNFLKNYRENLAYWPNLFTGHVRSGKSIAPKEKTGMKLNSHGDQLARINPESWANLVELKKKHAEINDRVFNQAELAKKRFPAETADKFAFKRQLGESTMLVINGRKADVEKQISDLKNDISKKSGVERSMVDELYKFEL